MRAVVLGAGVVGCAVALAAKAAGFDVTVMAERRMTDADAQSDPLFASAFPAASTIPHSVPGTDIGALAKASNTIFGALSRLPRSGVRMQRHFELWETEPQEPEYGRNLKDWCDIRNYAGRVPIRRPGASALFGYTFKMFFADMPVYAARLDGAVEAAGIAIARRRLDAGAVAAMDADVVFNCLGAGAAKVFPDLPDGFLYRGILLKFALDGLYTECWSGQAVSYNYTPAHDVYPAPGGGTWDVYFYPRENSCVLGGTRQQGAIDASGKFSGALYEGRTIEKDGVLVPAPILELNRELIFQLTARALPDAFTALVGYRHIHGTVDDPRLSIERRAFAGRCFIDCLGFGGAGVTLSWGAALRAVEIARAAMGSQSDGGAVEATLTQSLSRLFG